MPVRWVDQTPHVGEERPSRAYEPTGLFGSPAGRKGNDAEHCCEA